MGYGVLAAVNSTKCRVLAAISNGNVAAKGPVIQQMSIIRLLRLIIWLTSFGVGLCFGQEPMTGAVSHVSFSVTDAFGQVIREASIAITSQTQTRTVQTVRADEVIALPYGTYVFTASAEGAVPTSRIVNIVGPNIWVPIGLDVQFGDSLRRGGFITLKGVVLSKKHGLWAKVSGTFLPFTREARIDSSGRFVLTGLSAGIYTVTVFEGNRLLAAKAITLDLKRPVEEVTVPLGANLSR